MINREKKIINISSSSSSSSAEKKKQDQEPIQIRKKSYRIRSRETKNFTDLWIRNTSAENHNFFFINRTIFNFISTKVGKLG